MELITLVAQATAIYELSKGSNSDFIALQKIDKNNIQAGILALETRTDMDPLAKMLINILIFAVKIKNNSHAPELIDAEITTFKEEGLKILSTTRSGWFSFGMSSAEKQFIYFIESLGRFTQHLDLTHDGINNFDIYLKEHHFSHSSAAPEQEIKPIQPLETTPLLSVENEKESHKTIQSAEPALQDTKKIEFAKCDLAPEQIKFIYDGLIGEIEFNHAYALLSKHFSKLNPDVLANIEFIYKELKDKFSLLLNFIIHNKLEFKVDPPNEEFRAKFNTTKTRATVEPKKLLSYMNHSSSLFFHSLGSIYQLSSSIKFSMDSFFAHGEKILTALDSKQLPQYLTSLDLEIFLEGAKRSIKQTQGSVDLAPMEMWQQTLGI